MSILIFIIFYPVYFGVNLTTYKCNKNIPIGILFYLYLHAIKVLFLEIRRNNEFKKI